MRVVHGSSEGDVAERLERVLRSLFPGADVRRELAGADASSEVEPASASTTVRVLPSLASTELVSETFRGPVLVRRAVAGESTRPDVFFASDPGSLEALFGHIASQLGSSAPLDLGRLDAEIEDLVTVASGVSRRRSAIAPLAVAASALVIVVALAAWKLGADRDVTERFGFETEAPAWTLQASPGMRGFTALRRTDATPRRDRFALELTAHLDPTTADRRAGEAWVELAAAGASSTVDLRDITVVVWVKAQPLAERDAREPPEIQLFVKDRSWKACYGAPITATEDWTEVVLEVGERTASQHVDAGFDPSVVRALGIQAAAGADAKTSFAGHVYVDSVGW